MTADTTQAETGNISLNDLRRAVKDAVDLAFVAGADPLMTPRQVEAALGVGKTKRCALAKTDPRFPKEVVFSPRCRRYRSFEVSAYVEALTRTETAA